MLGKFNLTFSLAADKTAILDQVRLIAIASGANMALISWYGERQDSALGASGVVIVYDMTQFNPAKSQSGKLQSI